MTIPKKKKLPLPSRKERLEMYLPYIIKQVSKAEISRITGINYNTVRSDLHLRSKGVSGPNGNNGGENKKNPLINVKNATVSQQFDWEHNLDAVGRITLSIFQQTITGKVTCEKCGHGVKVAKDTPEGRAWLNTFATLYRSKIGGIKINVESTQNVNVINQTQINIGVQGEINKIFHKLCKVCQKVVRGE